MADSEAAEAAPKKSKKMLMMIVLVAVLALSGGGAGAVVMMSRGKTPEQPKPGEVVPLEPITINLAGGHYLKLGFALQATKDATEAPDGSKALDLAIAQYTDMEIAELSTTKGREAAKKELLKKIEKAYKQDEKPTVMDIYFTQFVTQ